MMFLRLCKLRIICCGHKMFLHKIKLFLCPGHKICVGNKFCACGQTGKHLCRQQCVRNNVSSFARAFRQCSSFCNRTWFNFQVYALVTSNGGPWKDLAVQDVLRLLQTFAGLLLPNFPFLNQIIKLHYWRKKFSKKLKLKYQHARELLRKRNYLIS